MLAKQGTSWAICVGWSLWSRGDRRDLLPLGSYEGIAIVAAQPWNA
ncbi:hypothetical protein QTH97_21140 [Variovorax sp. J22R24]|nr:hypothetical protein [Variovorax sp. J22R24]MDM0107466.1 hypothetical protein [Variovorax sp. J22R24]